MKLIAGLVLCTKALVCDVHLSNKTITREECYLAGKEIYGMLVQSAGPEDFVVGDCLPVEEWATDEDIKEMFKKRLIGHLQPTNIKLELASKHGRADDMALFDNPWAPTEED